MLAELGHHLVHVETDQAAFDRLRQEEFAAVLLPLQGQDPSGLDTARRLRDLPSARRLPILFLSDGHRDALEQAYEFGAIDHVVRPILPTLFKAKLTALIALGATAGPQADDRLWVTERRFRALTEHSSDVVSLLDSRATVLYVSPSITYVLGYAVEERVGQSGFDLVHPDDVGPTQAVLAELTKQPGGTMTTQVRIRHKDGSWRWVEAVGTNLLAEPAVGAVVVNYRDVTERKRAEHELRQQRQWLESVLNLLPVPLLFVEPGTARVTFANQAADALAGGEFPKGRPAEEYHTVYHCTDAAGRRIPDDEMPGVRVARGERLSGFEIDWHLPAGRRSVIIDADTLPAMHGHPAAGVILFQDVTRLKQVQAELRRANQAKDNFLSMLAHELRNPLAPVVNALHLMRLRSTDRAAVDRARDMVERQIEHLSRIVNDLLDVSRIRRGRIRLRLEPLDLCRLVRLTAEDHRPAVERAGLRLTVEVPDRPLWVLGDPTRLAQVLGNLLQNAVKFTESGGRVRVRLRAGSRDHAVLKVRDSGVGIEPGLLPHLFDTFSQADHSLDRSQGGLGLGLALVRGLVRLHKGTVHASSRGPGRGAVFIVRLPLSSAPAPTTRTPTPTPTPRPSHRILLVEDNRDTADSLRMALEIYGHEVTVAYTGREGARAAREARPDVIVCDIGLPELDGYAVARDLRRDPATAAARLIALTGYGGDEDRKRSREAGFDLHLVKPVDPAALHEAIARLT
jgi:PAS domain S-box-containing protein